MKWQDEVTRNKVKKRELRKYKKHTLDKARIKVKSNWDDKKRWDVKQSKEKRQKYIRWGEIWNK